MEQIKQYWAEDMVWLVPGHNPLAGMYHGLDGFLGFMGQVGSSRTTASTWSRSPS